MNIDKKQMNTAKKYADAFFKIASECNCVEKFYNEIVSFIDLLELSNDLKVYLENDLISKNDKKEVLYKVCQKDFDMQTINLLNVLIDNKRLNMLKTIYYCYEQNYEDSKNIVKVDIISAVKLSAEKKQLLMTKLETKIKKTLKANYIVDTNIIGGLIIKMQEKTIDLSLKTKLEEMNKQLIKG